MTQTSKPAGADAPVAVHMIWPEDRWVTETKVCNWALDLMHDHPALDPDPSRPATLAECIGILEDEGVATFTRELR